MLQCVSETGKSVARDILLGRPNIAAAVGVAGAVERLNSLIRMGDLTLSRLLIIRPSLSFLGKLRSDLQDELVRVTENACEMNPRVQA